MGSSTPRLFNISFPSYIMTCTTIYIIEAKDHAYSLPHLVLALPLHHRLLGDDLIPLPRLYSTTAATTAAVDGDSLFK